MRMLIADDHKQITDVLKAYATKEGYEVVLAHNGADALRLAQETAFDVVLLDVMMPILDGFEVCRTLRKVSRVPILMITARGEDFERIMGLDIGADDYIVKPFSPSEVMARVRAVLRRTQGEADADGRQVLHIKELTVDLDRACVTVSGHEIALTKKETDLLYLLAKNKERVFTREQLLENLWGYDYFGDSRTVDSHIKRLRAKLGACPHPGFELQTVWGRGYRLEVKDEA